MKVWGYVKLGEAIPWIVHIPHPASVTELMPMVTSKVNWRFDNKYEVF